jgi:hypothetical protein
VSTDAAVRIRVASSDRAPFDSRPVSTHEPGARPCFSGLRRTRPRARHPDFVSDSPALAIRSTSRVDGPSTESASTPTRLARVRSSSVTPPWLGDASETLAPVRSSSRSPSRVIVRVIAVRARSRVSESAVHAFGRRDRDALRPTSALRTIQLREPRASCAPGAEITRFDPRNLPRAEACASCSLFAAYIREPFSAACEASRARTPEGSGPADAERDQGNARFTTREPPGESIEIAWGLFVRSRESSKAPWMPLSPPPRAAAITLRIGASHEGRRDRFGARARESYARLFDPRHLPSS